MISRTEALLFNFDFAKPHNLQNLFHKTFISEVIPFADLPYLHNNCGMFMFISATIHSICHMIRWGLQGRLYVFTSNVTRLRSGAIYCLLRLSCRCILNKLKMFYFRTAKGLALLFYNFTLLLIGHAPKIHIKILVGIPFFCILPIGCIVLYSTHS